MIIERFYLGCLSHASYLVADPASGLAAVIDPQRDIDQYVQMARERGWTIQYSLLTHFHADFVAGHLDLRARLGSQVVIGSRAKSEFPSLPIDETHWIELGNVRLTALQTPGHTPDAITILAFDKQKSLEHPVAAFTGDTLFVGDVGRPDLLGSLGFEPRDLAGMLYDSIEKLKQLPDDTLVYPAHGAGSLCGKSLGKEPFTTIGAQKRLNYALQPMRRDAFIDLVLADQPFAPAYFVHDAIMNRREHATLETSLARSLQPLSLADVQAAQRQGAQLVDTRDAEAFAQGHLPGATNVGIDGTYATWAGTVLDKDRPIVVIAAQGREREATLRLGRIGFDQVVGYLDGGAESLVSAHAPLLTFRRFNASDLENLNQPYQIVDVRSTGERSAGQINDSIHIPLNELGQRADELPRDRLLVLHCAGGYRSAIAVSLLEQKGFTQLGDIQGGYKAWSAGRPATGAAPACAG